MFYYFILSLRPQWQTDRQLLYRTYCFREKIRVEVKCSLKRSFSHYTLWPKFESDWRKTSNFKLLYFIAFQSVHCEPKSYFCWVPTQTNLNQSNNTKQNCLCSVLWWDLTVVINNGGLKPSSCSMQRSHLLMQHNDKTATVHKGSRQCLSTYCRTSTCCNNAAITPVVATAFHSIL